MSDGPTQPNKRLAMLEQMTRSGAADSFAWYALAMEYRNAGELEKAVETFHQLKAHDASYVAQYLMAGQVLLELGRPAEAADWLQPGIELAQSVGDDKAVSELTAALEEATAG